MAETKGIINEGRVVPSLEAELRWELAQANLLIDNLKRQLAEMTREKDKQESRAIEYSFYRYPDTTGQ